MICDACHKKVNEIQKISMEATLPRTYEWNEEVKNSGKKEIIKKKETRNVKGMINREICIECMMKVKTMVLGAETPDNPNYK